MKPVISVLLLLLLTACSSEPSQNAPKGEFLYRRHDENLLQIEPMAPVSRPLYPWEDQNPTKYPKITKECFRCKGNILNPVKIIPKEKEPLRYYDCDGAQRHSLPVRNSKEFIYPVLLELLNDIQEKTGKRVIITCGHCCADHYTYIFPTGNQLSKHTIGAEVDFYVEGMERSPEQLVPLIMDYYRKHPLYGSQKDYTEFKRYEKGDLSLATMPWYNKEIFIKIQTKEEGRDGDNQHAYPYLTLQVRYDRDLKENVQYSADKAVLYRH